MKFVIAFKDKFMKTTYHEQQALWVTKTYILKQIGLYSLLCVASNSKLSATEIFLVSLKLWSTEQP